MQIIDNQVIVKNDRIIVITYDKKHFENEILFLNCANLYIKGHIKPSNQRSPRLKKTRKGLSQKNFETAPFIHNFILLETVLNFFKSSFLVIF